jgi:hypothetical protein
MGGVKELFKDEKQIKNLNPAKMGKVYQSMAKAMDPHMLRAIGGMQGIESMMKQMQAGGTMPGGMGMQGEMRGLYFGRNGNRFLSPFRDTPHPSIFPLFYRHLKYCTWLLSIFLLSSVISFFP